MNLPAGQPDTYLFLVAPPDLEETIIDLLLEHEDIVPRFITASIDTHGTAIALASVTERVRGRARRIEFKLLIQRTNVDTLLAAITEQLPRTGISWWLVPVLAYGRIE